MTPQEKAQELHNKIYQLECSKHFDDYSVCFCIAKQCALIAVDEMINTCDIFIDGKYFVLQKLYLEEVKTEIEKL